MENNKKKRKKLSPAEARERFSHREDIELCLDEYCGWKIKAKFYDKIAKDYFWSIPNDVLRFDTVHPKRRQEKKRKTNLKRLGVENPMQSDSVKEKVKKTVMKRYGKEHYLQTDDKAKKTKDTNLKKYNAEHHMKSEQIKLKVKKTLREKYGCDNPQQNEKIRTKTVETFRKKHGVSNPSQVKEFQRKKQITSYENWGVKHPLASQKIRNVIKASLKEKYGAEHPMLIPEFKAKRTQTMLQKYGVEHWSKTTKFKTQINKKKVSETQEWVSDWLDNIPEPKPSVVSVNQQFVGQDNIPQEELEKYVAKYRSAKSDLEKLAENLFVVSHYNEKPAQLKKTFRPDFKLSDSVFVNVDGLYWHSELQKEKWYHFILRQEFESSGLRIFQFREDEIRDKPHIVKSIVNNSLGKTKAKVYARKCLIKPVKHEEAISFLQSNHLMGSTYAKHVGLYYENVLVCLLSFKCRKEVCKIERFCSLVNTNVIGGFTKLLRFVEKQYLYKNPNIEKVYNWVDLRYGTGYHLLTKGFVATKETLGWKWTDGKNTFNRLRCRANMDSRNLSQKEYAIELGWYKIYDAGQRLWVKNLKEKKQN